MPLKVASLNVRGLNAHADSLGGIPKRVALWKWVKVHKIDVLLLQETHATTSTATGFWTKQWGGQALWAPSTTPHSGGTAILVTRQIKGTLKNKSTGPDGSWAREDLETEEGTLTFLSAYAPTDPPARGQWIQNTLSQGLRNLKHPTIAGGDWNCVSNGTLDSISPYTGLLQGGKAIDQLMAENGRDDVLRITQPDHKWFTRWEGLHGNRLDRIFASGSLCEETMHLAPIMCPWSDHYLLPCIFRAETTRWKRPAAITAEPTFSHPEMAVAMDKWDTQCGMTNAKAEPLNPE